MRIIFFIISIVIMSCVNKGSNKDTKKIEEQIEQTGKDESDVTSDIINEDNSFEVFWGKFSKAVLERDTSTLNSLVYFPFVDFHNEVYDPQSTLTCRSKDDFRRRYDEIFNECVLTAIEQKKIRGHDKDYGEFGDVIGEDDYLLMTECEERNKDFLFRIINGRYYLYGIQYYQ